MFYSQLSGRSCFITHTVMRRKFTFILRVLSEQRKTTQLSEGSSKRGGWGCCRSHVAAFGKWMEQHKTGAAELLLFLVCFFFFTENSQIVKKNKNNS